MFSHSSPKQLAKGCLDKQFGFLMIWLSHFSSSMHREMIHLRVNLLNWRESIKRN